MDAYDPPTAWSIRRIDLLRNTLLVESSLVIIAVILGWLLGPDVWQSLSWNWNDALWGCLAALPPLIIILLIDLFPFGPFRHVADISERILRPLLRECRWPDYFLLSALAGFCEELLFRGWLQPFLNQWVPLWSNLLIGGFLFALCHLITPAYFVIAWLISLYLGFLLIWTDNLLVPMLAHGVYDLLAIFAVMSQVDKPTRSEPPPPESEAV